MKKTKTVVWLRFIKLILTKGSLLIKPYDYGVHIQKLWDENQEAYKLNITPKNEKRSWIFHLLYLPLIGPLVAVVSQYRQQQKWTSYVYHWKESKLAFIRISKNAGTTVQAAILQRQYPALDISKLGVNQINEMGKLYIKPYREPGYKCFALVRNPYDRLLSCYFDQVIGREERFYYDDYAFRVIKKGMSFYDFVYTIADIPDVLKDIHFRPQSHYISSVKNVKCFKIESEMELVEDYLKPFELKLGMQNRNKTKHDKRDYYTSELRAIVAEIYKEDFQHFGYSIDD